MLSLIYIINILASIYQWMIIGYILLSWFPNARDSYIGHLLARLVEPYLSVFRRFVPPLGFIDFSPIIAVFALYFIKLGLISVIDFFV